MSFFFPEGFFSSLVRFSLQYGGAHDKVAFEPKNDSNENMREHRSQSFPDQAAVQFAFASSEQHCIRGSGFPVGELGAYFFIFWTKNVFF